MTSRPTNTKHPLRVGVIGTGAIGQEHIKNLKLLRREGIARVAAIADSYYGSRARALKLLRSSNPRRFASEEMQEQSSINPRQKEINNFVVSAEEKAAGKRVGVAIFADHKAMIAASPSVVDAVIVATPNDTHVNILRDVVTSGVHILCEKPLCTTVAHCQETEALLRREGYLNGSRAMFWVGMEYRYIPSVARLLEEVDGGVVGKEGPRMVSIREHRFPFLKKVGDWNRFASRTGGTLVEKCCHFFDLMARILKPRKPLRVFATGAQDVNHKTEIVRSYPGRTPNIIDNAYVIIEWEGGVRSALDICMFAEASRNQEEISVVGPAGKIEAFAPAHGVIESAETDSSPFPAPGRDSHSSSLGHTRAVRTDDSKNVANEKGKQSLGSPNVIIGRRRPWIESVVPPPPPPPLERLKLVAPREVQESGHHAGATYYELKRFAKAIQRGPPFLPEVSLYDGLLAVALGEAAHRSIREGRAVEICEMLQEEGRDGVQEEMQLKLHSSSSPSRL